MKIVGCKTNHLINPIGYKMDKPIFSYQVTESNGKEQTGACIRISLSEDMSRTIFETDPDEKIDSLAYAADIPLLPRTKYFWTVTVSTDVNETLTSEINTFETGKREEEWEAKWITCDSTEPRHPVFYKDIVTEKTVKSARLYCCGLGLYEVYWNGGKISCERLTPYCNNYDKWLQYQTYDVSDLMKSNGQLSFLLGNGWYKGRFWHNGVDKSVPFYGEDWKLIAELRIVYTDGSEAVIGTDDSWSVKRSKIIASSIYDGEVYDATLPDFPDVAAIVCDAPEAELTERFSTPVTVHEEISSKKLIHTPSGETVLDMGQNFAGIFRMRVHVPKDTIVRLQFGEILQNGNFYRDNLRSAKAEYVYISDGKEHTPEPHFTFFGYRYVKIEGIENLKIEDFTGLALYSELQKAGFLTTGNNHVNKLIQNTEWSMKSNFIDVPTDCPQRDERMGWTGDAQVFSPTACFLADSYAFYRKYLHDMAQEQSLKGGMVPNVVPSFGMDICSSVWGDAACIIPWNLYLFYGDSDILFRQYNSMKAWVDYISKTDGDNHHWRDAYHFGDWLALDNPNEEADQTTGGTDEGFIADIYYSNSASILSKAAGILGKADEAEKYRKLSRKIKHDIRKEYFFESGRCCINTQTALLLTLWYDLLDSDERTKIALQRKLKESNNKLKTGFVGTPLLCNVLSENNMSDIAYRLLLNEEYPGWLYAIDLGATTIWERWNSVMPDGSMSTTGMNSLNHYAYGSVLEWLFRYSAGINPVEESPGFRKIKLIPTPEYRLKYLEAVCNTSAGTYKSYWNVLDENHLELSFTVPFGCEAELSLPFALDSVYENNSNPIFADVRNKICHLTAGDYEISYETDRSMRKIYNTYLPIKELLQNIRTREILNRYQMDLIPSSLHDLSLRMVAEKFGNGAQSEQLDFMDSELEKIE